MVTREQIRITPFKCSRTLHIYTPDDIGPEERLPVLYMFDGHNLFYDSDATYGKSWGMKKYLDSHHTRLIVVGLECNHEGWSRLDEFSPYSYDDPCGYRVHQRGRELIAWMTSELKDYIDSHYPTLPDRTHTYIGGSSMGGLMSLYMILTRSDVYSKGISVSPHLYPMYRQLKDDIGHPLQPDTSVYISWGGHEYDTPQLFARVTDQNLQLIRALLKKPGVDVLPHVFKNDDHSESAWEKEMHVWMNELEIT